MGVFRYIPQSCAQSASLWPLCIASAVFEKDCDDDALPADDIESDAVVASEKFQKGLCVVGGGCLACGEPGRLASGNNSPLRQHR